MTAEQRAVLIDQDRQIPEYVQILQQFGLQPLVRGPWAVVSVAPYQVQGWKLHLSSIETEVVRLLTCVVPLLCAHQVSFKIAKDAPTLGQLNEGRLGPTQIGKFMTIYPTTDQQARQLAEQLIDLTPNFHGPVVVTDLQLGTIVYTRYGNFNPVITSDRLGQTFLSIYTPDGSLRPDLYEVPFVPPKDVPNPFADLIQGREGLSTENSPGTPETEKASKLFGPGYLFTDVVKADAKGSVFRVLDLRSQAQVAIKILKQGRQYCLSDEYGRDIRTRLRRQELLHHTLHGLVPIPQADPYFEVKGDGYLPLEYIEGQTIEQLTYRTLANRSWGTLPRQEQIRLLTYLEKLLTAVAQLHHTGYVHRDLTASNIWIGADEQVYLLDLELAHRLDDPTTPFGMGTLGFASPAQQAHQPPSVADDVYALGCVMVLVMTGLDPQLVLFANEARRREQLLLLTHGGTLELIELIVHCVSTNASVRPTLAVMKGMIGTVCRQLSRQGQGESQNAGTLHWLHPGRRHDFSQYLHEVMEKGQQGLFAGTIREAESGLWLSPAFSGNAHLTRRDTTGSYEIRRDANRGVAGVVYLLGRLGRLGLLPVDRRWEVQQTVEWLINQREPQDQLLPGLHFGEAGIAVALAEAIAGGLLSRSPQIDQFLSTALAGRLDWPDVTHGAAGQGIASLTCAARLHDSTFLAMTHRCAEYLIETQQADGAWVMPAGVEGMSGQTLTGFAHGVAGIVYFLAAYEHHFGSSAAQHAWQAGAAWLIRTAIPAKEGQALEWPYSDAHPERWRWWCHGSPGIALTFLRLYEQSREEVYADMARRALNLHPPDLRYPNLSQCHGLSGLGEIYLEAGRVLADEQWDQRARHLGEMLVYLGRETENKSLVWLVEDPHLPTADLMVGSSGVIHFFARLGQKKETISFPLLLDPITS